MLALGYPAFFSSSKSASFGIAMSLANTTSAVLLSKSNDALLTPSTPSRAPMTRGGQPMGQVTPGTRIPTITSSSPAWTSGEFAAKRDKTWVGKSVKARTTTAMIGKMRRLIVFRREPRNGFPVVGQHSPLDLWK